MLLGVLLLMGASSGVAQAVELDVTLYGTNADPGASGIALYRDFPEYQRLVVEMGGITEATGVLVYVGEQLADDVGIVEGVGRLELDTREGHSVPEVTESSVIRVYAAGTETVILTSDPEEAPERIRIELRLFGTDLEPLAFGEGFYVEEPGYRRLLIELAEIEYAEGVLFYVDGEFVEDMAVVEGTVRLNLDTREGQSVPEVTEESLIEVVEARMEDVILSNHRDTEDDRIACSKGGYVAIGEPVVMTAPNGAGFQWRFNGVDIEGATGRILIILAAELGDEGVYTVVYYNGQGKALVEPPPSSSTFSPVPSPLPATGRSLCLSSP